MGSARFEEWLAVRELRRLGQASVSDEYELFRSREEVSLVFSPQAELTWEIFNWLDLKAQSYIQEGSRVLDLGCGYGLFCSWLASQYSSIEIVGVDNSESLLSIAESEVIPNCRYHKWDYGAIAADEGIVSNLLFCSLGIDFNTGNYLDLEVEDLRSTNLYESKYSEALPYFTNWRSACESGGKLFIVLRIPIFVHFIAIIDAATKSGWTLELSESTKISALGASLPALQFSASKQETPSDNLVEAFWMADNIESSFRDPSSEPLAGTIYRLLTQKNEILRGDRKFDDGHTMRTVVGTAGPFAYRFTQTTAGGFERLQLLPATKVNELKISFDWFESIEHMEKTTTKPSRKKKSR